MKKKTTETKAPEAPKRVTEATIRYEREDGSAIWEFGWDYVSPRMFVKATPRTDQEKALIVREFDCMVGMLRAHLEPIRAEGEDYLRRTALHTRVSVNKKESA